MNMKTDCTQAIAIKRSQDQNVSAGQGVRGAVGGVVALLPFNGKQRRINKLQIR